MAIRPVEELEVSRETIIEEIIFLGTGTSSCTPLIGCLMKQQPDCHVCLSAAGPGPSRNRRLNPSALIRYRPRDGGPLRNILIDCGKTFYSAALQFLVRDQVGPLEGVLLTHGHADAVHGLDDLRHFTGHQCLQDHVDVWADSHTMQVVQRTFPYLVNSGDATGGGFVSSLRFHQIGPDEGAIRIGELDIRPFVVEHGVFADGSPFPCLGFILDGLLAYISDVSRIPPQVIPMIQEMELMVLDCLREHRPYQSHFILPDAMETVRVTRPRRTFFVGMAHDVEHDEFEGRVRRAFPKHDIRLAYDGLVLRLIPPINIVD